MGVYWWWMAIKVFRIGGVWGGEEKKWSRSIFFFLVFLIDVLCRGWVEEWIGIGLRVGMGVY